ncbi:MAG: hypothetical protein ACYSU0_11650 [Planctomycetota bacterium]|jgi:hypothetical protein
MPDMIPDRPTIGALFDISKMGPGIQQENCWRIFWSAVDPGEIKGTKLFEGALGTTAGGDCFCIAVQGMDASPLQTVMASLLGNDHFKSVCVASAFAQGESVTAQPLALACEIDIFGTFAGDPGASRSALEAARPNVRARSAGESPGGMGDVSPMTTIGSHLARAALMGDPLGGAPAEPEMQIEAVGPDTQVKPGGSKAIVWIVVGVAAAALIAVLVLIRLGVIPVGGGPVPAGGKPAGTSLDGSAKPGPKKGAASTTKAAPGRPSAAEKSAPAKSGSE